jgi:hypothetical protein
MPALIVYRTRFISAGLYAEMQSAGLTTTAQFVTSYNVRTEGLYDTPFLPQPARVS